jgi:uncharacterized protein YcnI
MLLFARSHRFRRALALAAVATFAVAGFAIPAGAHVTVQPQAARKGSFSTLNFSVPNERDDASTVEVEVNFPTDQPLASVAVQPTPGWSWSADKTKLATPIKTDDGDVSEAVTKITWTRGRIDPGEFQLFTIAAGPLPTKGKAMEFKVLQTYSNGDIVRWIEDTPKGGPEPDFPAPLLQLVGKPKSS